MTDPSLVIFDMDGTLVDSQADILAAMAEAFAAVGRPAPDRATVLGIVGLSLPQAIAQLAPDAAPQVIDRMVAAYKDRYTALRHAGQAAASPLYPGMGPLLERLHARGPLLLGVATGKSRRGLDALLDSLDLRRFFVTLQVADDHPSKPHPSMLHAALAETGVPAGRAVMIGDTEFDIAMAQAARIPAIAVAWGYHPVDRLAGARAVVQDAAALESAIDAALSGA